MKASELRLGNLVLCNTSIGFVDAIASVCNLSSDEIVCYHKPTKQFIFCKDALFEPIPLTEEWLLKFGCGKVKSDIPTFSIVYGEFIEDDYEHCLIINLDVDNNFYIVVNGVKLILKHLHQLQNLYFALTGEELK